MATFKGVTDAAILQLIQKEYVTNETTTVMYKDIPDEEASAWCKKQGWGYVREAMMFGSEDQCVVLLRARPTVEFVSRGRNLLVMVTTRGDGWVLHYPLLLVTPFPAE